MATASVTLHFQPDWPYDGGLVVDGLVATGRYRSQFETGISSGGLTAHPGGDRWRWESRLFDGRYDTLDAAERPVYGSFNRGADPYGGSPRFGSAYVRLRPELLERTTFCFPDSVFEPEAVGDAAELSRLCALADEAGNDLLDDYVEAHVHGGVYLAEDVEAVVVDPCHAVGPVAEALEQLGVPIEHHPGYRVVTADLPEDYRGSEPVALARELGDVLTPDVIAVAARSGAHDPQTVKRVWHLLARFGRANS